MKFSINQLIRCAIIVYWSVFWLLNSLDKVFGGSSFLWVGRDRFAQFYKFFSSAGIDSPLITNLALVIAAGLEIFAFVFFTGALIKFIRNQADESRSWFLIGIVLTLVTFTIFSIGDHVFGDRFELLEHTLFWFITLLSWAVFVRLEKMESPASFGLSKKQLVPLVVAVSLISIGTSGAIVNHSQDNFHQRTAAIQAEEVGNDIYKVSFPFLGGSTVFEKSLELFKKDFPNKVIKHIYTAPNPLRLKKADSLIFYIITEEKK